VHQAKYTKDILKKFKMDKLKPLSIPMSTTTALETDEDGEPVDQKEYRSMIGSLLYFMSVRNMVPTLTSRKRRGLSLNGRC
jgi:hypothetical protein